MLGDGLDDGGLPPGGVSSVSNPHNFGEANIWMDELIACWRVGWHSVNSLPSGDGPFDVWSGIFGVVKLQCIGAIYTNILWSMGAKKSATLGDTLCW